MKKYVQKLTLLALLALTLTSCSNMQKSPFKNNDVDSIVNTIVEDSSNADPSVIEAGVDVGVGVGTATAAKAETGVGVGTHSAATQKESNTYFSVEDPAAEYLRHLQDSSKENPSRSETYREFVRLKQLLAGNIQKVIAENSDINSEFWVKMIDLNIFYDDIQAIRLYTAAGIYTDVTAVEYDLMQSSKPCKPLTTYSYEDVAVSSNISSSYNTETQSFEFQPDWSYADGIYTIGSNNHIEVAKNINMVLVEEGKYAVVDPTVNAYMICFSNDNGYYYAIEITAKKA